MRANRRFFHDVYPTGLSMRALAIPGIVFALAAAFLSWLIYRAQPPADSMPTPAVVEVSTAPEPNRPDPRLLLQPAFDRHTVANELAVTRCTERVREYFQKYRRGIPRFADDVNSWSTRFGLIRRAPGDWWRRERQAERYIRDKFEKHLFSDDILQHDLAVSLAAFREDLQANRNRLLVEVEDAYASTVSTADLSKRLSGLGKNVDQEIAGLAHRQATDSMYGGIASLLLSEVAAISAAEIVVRVAAGAIGTAATTAATAGGGAAVGAAGAGAAGGTAAGPAGTLVGAGVGLIVGLGVDWWMSAQLEKDLREQTLRCLDQLEHAIIEGEGSEPGLRQSLDAFCEDYDSVQRQAFFDALR